MDFLLFFVLTLASLTIVSFFAFIVITLMATFTQLPVVRGDAAGSLNSGKNYGEFLMALDAVRKEFKLREASIPSSLAELVASCVGGKPLLLLEGRQLTVSACLAGNELVTQIEAPGDFPLAIGVVTKSALHLPGLGVDFVYLGGKEIALGRLAVRPASDKDGARVRAALKPRVVERLEEVVLIKPRVANLSSKEGDFYDKKLTVAKDRALLRDYGLPRDPHYFVGLASKFLKFASAWQKAK
jgi:hypothetical protein